MTVTFSQAMALALPLVPAYFLSFYFIRFALPLRSGWGWHLLFAVYSLIQLLPKPAVDLYWQINGYGKENVYLVTMAMVFTLPFMLLICFTGSWQSRLFLILPWICVQSVLVAPICLFVMEQSWPMPLARELPYAVLFLADNLLVCWVTVVLLRRLVHWAETLPRRIYTVLALLSPLGNLLANLEQAATMERFPGRVLGIARSYPHLLVEMGVLLLFFFWLLHRQVRQTLAIAAAREEMQRSALQVQQRSVELLRGLRRQHRRSLEQLAGLLDRQDVAGARRMLEQMTCRSSQVVQRYADNPVADVALADAADRCARAGVGFSIQGTLPRRCTLPPVDMASLLYNLLSNGVRAAARAPRPARVEITFRTAAGRLCIMVRNPVAPGPAPSRGDGHGFGRKILQEIAARYDGSYTLEIRDGEATAVVLVCLPEETPPLPPENGGSSQGIPGQERNVPATE